MYLGRYGSHKKAGKLVDEEELTPAKQTYSASVKELLWFAQTMLK